MITSAIAYFKILSSLFGEVKSTINGNDCSFEQAIDESIQIIINQTSVGGKVLFIGNGASASISSHMAADFSKNAGIKALAFNDSAMLTCISNDYGYKHVFEKCVNMFADQEDVLVAISGSGKSENILRAALTAKEKGLNIITLSGFDEDNPLRKLGDISFYVPAHEYGLVEVVHLGFCHYLVDTIVGMQDG